MFIIPYVYKRTIIHQMQVTIIQVLTIGGTLLWKEADDLDIENDILLPNGIQVKGTPAKKDDQYFCEVDESQTAMNDFYCWEEIPKEDRTTFCWRSYYLFGEGRNYRSWLPIPSNERLEPYSCRDVMDQIHEIHKAVEVI